MYISSKPHKLHRHGYSKQYIPQYITISQSKMVVHAGAEDCTLSLHLIRSGYIMPIGPNCTFELAAILSLSTQMSCSLHLTVQLILAVMSSCVQQVCMKTTAYGRKSKTLGGLSTVSRQTGKLSSP